MKWILAALVVLGAVPFSARSLPAQPGVIGGQVLSDAPERPISGARVELRARNLSARTDSLGRFRFAGMTPGEYTVVIHAIGYDSLVATLRLAPSDVIDADFLLTRSAQQLKGVTVEADGGLTRLRLSEFDERRTLGHGSFIDSTVFAKNANSQVDVVVIGRVPGLRVARKAGKMVFAAQRDGKLCYPQVIVNGQSLWNGTYGDPRTKDIMLFDVNTLRADEIIGFEWHNPASTPSKYNGTGAGNDGSICGTAIFWTR